MSCGHNDTFWKLVTTIFAIWKLQANLQLSFYLAINSTNDIAQIQHQTKCVPNIIQDISVNTKYDRGYVCALHLDITLHRKFKYKLTWGLFIFDPECRHFELDCIEDFKV